MRAITDFTWAELGTKVRHLRTAKRLTQQQLADATGVTQNAIFRIEAGETNPQISTLSGIANALGTSVRELMGVSGASDSELAPWISRIRKIVGSKDQAAIQAMQNGLENAELLLSRSLLLPPPRIVLKGEDTVPSNLFWSQLPIRRRSETKGRLRKARKPAARRSENLSRA